MASQGFFFKSLISRVKLPRLTLPRRIISDDTFKQRFLDSCDEFVEKVQDGLYRQFRRMKFALKKQSMNDWKRRFIALSDFTSTWIKHPRVPKHLGLVLTLALFASSFTYGIYIKDKGESVFQALADLKDDGASAVGFDLKTIALNGSNILNKQNVTDILGLKKNQSLLFLDLEKAKARLQQEPFIAEATLVKTMPNTLTITLKERVAIAQWQYMKKLTVIANDGTILLHEKHTRFQNLPYLVGKNANTDASRLIEALDAFPEIKELVKASVYVGERSWHLYLKNGVEVKLPEIEIVEALRVFAKLEREQRLTDKDMYSIDLRVPHRVALRVSPSAMQARGESYKLIKKERSL